MMNLILALLVLTVLALVISAVLGEMFNRADEAVEDDSEERSLEGQRGYKNAGIVTKGIERFK